MRDRGEESPRAHLELRTHGIRVSKKRVERLMRENGLVGRQKSRFIDQLLDLDFLQLATRPSRQ
jgi:transposase InsO family protein